MPSKKTAEERSCPMCAEPIKAKAIVCPHCRARLESHTTLPLSRDRPGRQIGGVCASLAEHFGISVTFLRLAFVILTFVHFIGPIAYVILWVLMPSERGQVSPLDRTVGRARSMFDGGSADGRALLERIMARLRDLAASIRESFEAPAGPRARSGNGHKNGEARS